MSGCFFYSIFVENFTDKIRTAYCSIEKFILSCCLIVCYASLNELTHVEGFMTEIPIILPLYATHPFMKRIAYGPVCEKISVRFMCRTYNINHSINIILKFFITLYIKQIRCTFNHFIYFSIIISRT